MKIGVLSGKGGTGKTTVAVNLALAMNYDYMDCDVEEPNGFLFFKNSIEKRNEVHVWVPTIDENKCVLCGKCAEYCKFNALANTGKKIMVFNELCHSCYACKILCKYDAIHMVKRNIGYIDEGNYKNLKVTRGILNVGEPMATPIIKKIHDYMGENTIIDCAPGTTCTVVETIENLDYVLLVTESTLFGLHDLEIAVKLVKSMNIPFKVIINKWQDNEIIEKYCEEEHIHIIEKIPLDKEIATIYSKGQLLMDNKKYLQLFNNIKNKLTEVEV